MIVISGVPSFRQVLLAYRNLAIHHDNALLGLKVQSLSSIAGVISLRGECSQFVSDTPVYSPGKSVLLL
jgi:hypothetical protein